MKLLLKLSLLASFLYSSSMFVYSVYEESEVSEHEYWMVKTKLGTHKDKAAFVDLCKKCYLDEKITRKEYWAIEEAERLLDREELKRRANVQQINLPN